MLATRAGVCASRLTAVFLFSGALLAPGASQWSAGLSEVASAAVALEARAGGLRGAVRSSRPPVLWIPHGPPRFLQRRRLESEFLPSRTTFCLLACILGFLGNIFFLT